MHVPSDPRLRFAAGIAGILLILLVAPMIPVSTSFTIFDNYRPGASSCFQAGNSTDFGGCLEAYRYGPVNTTAVATLAHLLWGLGPPPFPSTYLVNQGYASALVRSDGMNIEYAEGPFEGPSVLNPAQTLEVQDFALRQSSEGYLTFSASIRNVATHPVEVIGAYVDYPGYGSNRSLEGLTWHTGSSPVCVDVSLEPGRSCEASAYAAPNDQLDVGSTYPMSWVVVGLDPSLPHPLNLTSGAQVTPYSSLLFGNFVTVETSGVGYPGYTNIVPDSQWVQAFISLVNSGRGSLPLVENSSLDAFALKRFQTAVANYSISDYGFDNQSKAYIGDSRTLMTEEILYPAQTPSDFAGYLQTAAPGHWQGLVSLTYTKYGFFLGYGPVIEFKQDCPVTEITGRNINITQVAIENGCQYEVTNATYLLIVLSS
jgi:hypothetical protein